MLCSLSRWWLHFSFRDLWLDLWPWCLSFFSGLSARFFLLFFSSDELWEQNLHQKHCSSLKKFHVNLCSFACWWKSVSSWITPPSKDHCIFRHIKRPCIWWPMHIAQRITVSTHPHQIYSHTALLKTWCTFYIIRKKVFTAWWGRKELLPTKFQPTAQI